LLYCYDISLENFLKHTFLTFFSPWEAFGGSKGWVTGGGCIEMFFLLNMIEAFGFQIWLKKHFSFHIQILGQEKEFHGWELDVVGKLCDPSCPSADLALFVGKICGEMIEWTESNPKCSEGC
jgi:hypothetical protein